MRLVDKFDFTDQIEIGFSYLHVIGSSGQLAFEWAAVIAEILLI